MSLQAKFAVLTVLLGLTVVGGLFVAMWSVQVLEEELATPYRTTTSVLNELREIKRNIEAQSEILAGRMAAADEGLGLRDPDEPLEPRPATSEEIAAFRNVAEDTDARLEKLESLPWYDSLVGRSNTRNLRRRIEVARATGREWIEATATANEPGPPSELVASRMQARRDFYHLHEFMEMLEGRILSHSEHAVAYGRTVRHRMLVVIASACVIAVLAVVLRLTLDRRWVMKPVANLRAAATRIAAGDFDHRIPVEGRDELALLSAEFNHMAEMVRAMQEERVERERLAAVGEMVRRIVHNLRNPLAGIRSMAELSREDLPVGSRTHEKQDRIIAAVDRFEQWLAELLSASAPLAVKPRRTPIRPWLDAIVDAHRPMAENKNVAVEAIVGQNLAEAVFDPRQLELALVALVSNAIQATPKGTRVAITAETVPGDRRWRVRVTDEGPGVPPDLREKVFQPYFTTRRDGNGIGLAVARQIVKAHGGRIAVFSAGEGNGRAASNGSAGGGQAAAAGGAAFEVLLPVNGPTAAEGDMSRAEDSGDGRRGESAAVPAGDA